MTKYIVKKILYSAVTVFILGFVLYMLSMTRRYDSDVCFAYNDEIGAVILRADTLYYYKQDYEASCFTPFYFIPVDAAKARADGRIRLPNSKNENNLAEKYYISPFTDEHIVVRYGLSSRVYTLYKTERLVTP